MLHFICVICFLASVVAKNAPQCIRSRIQTSNITVEFPVLNTASGHNTDVIAYEVSYKSLFDQDWTVSSSTLGSSGNYATAMQVISVRVDEGATITSGTFMLGIERLNEFAEDLEHTARTVRIPFDADSGTMKAALDGLGNIQIKEVRRCDEFGGNGVDVGSGSLVDGWAYACPYGAQGGYRWLVVFENTPSESQVPLLFPYNNELGNTYSGPGKQVSVTHIHRGMISQGLCQKGVCYHSVTHLVPNTPYSFRSRGLTLEFGWTDYSDSSEYCMTKEARAPLRPRPPVVASIEERGASLSVHNDLKNQDIVSVHSQYRITGNGNQWYNGPVVYSDRNANIDKSGSGLYVGRSEYPYIPSIVLSNLEPGTNYEVRVKCVNMFGSSPYSLASQAFTTKATTQYEKTPNPPSVIKVTDNAIDLLVSTNSNLQTALGRVDYEVQYRTVSEENWHSVSDILSLSTRRRGTEIQEFFARQDSISTGCSGYFHLALDSSTSGDDERSLDVKQTSPIAFDASAEDFKAAIYAIPSVASVINTPSEDNSEPVRITVRRSTNALFGYTWTVEFEGFGDIPLLRVSKHSLLSANNTYCWTMTSTNTPVVARTIRNGAEFQDTSESINKQTSIYGLTPQTEYALRTIYYHPPDSRYQGVGDIVSEQVVVTTLPQGGRPIGDSGVTLSTDSVSSFRLPVQEKLGNYYMDSGNSMYAARMSDFHYIAGSGVGGTSQQRGSNGHCVVITYNALLQQSFQTMVFYYVGEREQEYIVPIIHESEFGTVNQLTMKCWGAGGGGGKITDLVNGTQSKLQRYSVGGGGAFAQLSLPVAPGDSFTIIVGGGGSPNDGETGGKGGYGGGGSGGKGANGGGGGGGGGASYIRRANELLLVAAGGGGAGSTDYCCSHGGAGGAAVGSNGIYPANASQWPLNSSEVPTNLTRRYEYTSAACPDSSAGSWCISEWDILPASLPAEHKNLAYGYWPNEDYTAWALAGLGGNAVDGGLPGASGSFNIRTTGYATAVMDGQVAIYSQGEGWQTKATQGLLLRGGTAADGVDGGGGGGGGYYGGGGGGAGIDGAGGGGGSSFINSTSLSTYQNSKLLPNTRISSITGSIDMPVVMFVNDSAVTLSWGYDWSYSLWGIPERFEVEQSIGDSSEDYTLIGIVFTNYPNNDGFNGLYHNNNNQTITAQYTVGNLPPLSTNRFRVVPLFSKGRGYSSEGVVVTTLNYASTYWEPIIPRRQAVTSSGRGLTNTVMQRPHLDTTGVQLFQESTWEDIIRINDPPNSLKPTFPASRRGHSMTLADDKVYMFGGRTDGYSCASVYTDLLNIGNVDSGRLIIPCTSYGYQNEVHELWSFDIHTYTWSMINTTKWGNLVYPPAREQHSATYVAGDLYIFGGKARVYPIASDIVLNDLWKLTIPHSVYSVFNYSDNHVDNIIPQVIPRSDRLYAAIDATDPTSSDPTIATEGLCIENVIVEVEIEHDCLSQLRLSIQGPGPQSGSPNFHVVSASDEITLFDQPRSNATGCISGKHLFTFEDNLATVITTSPSGKDTYECCGDRNNQYQGNYKPDGKLSEFIGSTMASQWTLVVQDMKPDGLSGNLLGWNIKFKSFPCVPKYSWTNLTKIDTSVPIKRYHAVTISYDTSLFIYGGRDVFDRALSDLHRYDTLTDTWTVLSPMNFDFIFPSSSSFGYNLAMTSWGLLKYGGYSRQPYITGTSYNYADSDDIYLCDIVSMKWKKIELNNVPMPPTKTTVAFPTETLPQGRGDSGVRHKPPMRYLSSMVFIPSSATHWLQSSQPLSYREYYDEHTDSSRANYVNKIIDSLMLFGGSNGATGSVFDGSTGGMLNDIWALRLANWSTPGVRFYQQEKLNAHCLWRNTTNAIEQSNTHSCMDTVDNTACELRDLLMLVWCGQNNQTIS